MSSYTSVESRELLARGDCKTLNLTPFTVQSIVFELIKNHLLNNSATKMGFPEDFVYDTDFTKSKVLLSLSFNYDAKQASKRPAIFIFRDEVAYQRPSMGQTIQIDPQNSEYKRLVIQKMNVGVACININVGPTEFLAEFVRRPLLDFEHQIKTDFKFRQFKLDSSSKPQSYKEATDNFIIVHNLQISFDDNVVIRRDDLKLKTVAYTIFNSLTPDVPILNQ